MYECPKCNFLQPKDKYCANCGIDIDRYLNKQQVPAHIKFFKDPVVQLSALILALFLFIAFIYSKNQNPNLSPTPEVESTEVATQQAPEASTTSPKKELAQIATSQKTAAKKVTPKTQSLVKSPKEQEEAKVQTLALKKVAQPETQESTALSSLPTRLQIRFAEVNQESLQNVFQTGEDINESGLLRSAIFSTTKKLKEILPNVSYLAGRKTARIPLKNPLRAFFPEEEEDIGLKLNIIPSEDSSQPLTFSASLSLILNGDDGSSLANGGDSLSGIKISSNKYILMEIKLPRAKLLQSLADKVPSTPLSIYDSQEFLDGQTTLLVVIEAI